MSLGLLDGRIQVEGPIRKDRTSFNISLRRSWIDLLMKPALAIVNSGNKAAIAANGLENFRRDTVWVSLLDSLYKSEDFVADSLCYIPFSQGDKFELIAVPVTTRSGTIMQVMECNAPDSSFLKGMGKAGKRLIYNRAEEADAKGAYAGLKIGEAGSNWNNNAGNWE